MSERIAVITGASRGLGRSIARHLAQEGVHIVGTYRNDAAQAQEFAAEVRAFGVKAAAVRLDVTQMADIAAFASQLATLLPTELGRPTFDYLVNNAGTGLSRPFAQTTQAEFDALVAVHLKAPFFMTQSLLPLIADGGSILNISSGLARFTLPGSSAYAMMKGGVEVFTRYLARELGERKITANVIAPGAIAADFNNGAIRDNADLNARVAAQIPLGRVGEADDVGAAAAALLLRSGHWINGTRIEVSGGQNL